MRPAWTELPDESSESYRAFLIYRDLGGTRSIQKVGKRLGKNSKALARLSKKYGWVARAKEYDAYVGQRTGEAIAEKQARQARLYYDVGTKLLEKLMSRLDEDAYYDTETLTKTVIQFFTIFKKMAKMDNVMKNPEDRTSPPPSNSEEGISINGSEPMESDGRPMEGKINETTSSEQNSQPLGAKSMAEERQNSSEEVPARPRSLKRRSTVVAPPEPESGSE